jgi:hypothetical protein
MNYPLYQKTSNLIFDTDLLGTRFTLGLAELIWALTLFWPGDTFDRPTYEIMSHLFSEHTWGFIFLLSGVTQLTIAISGLVDHWFSKLFAGWNAVIWIYVVISMYFSVTPPPAAISGEAALALASIWIWVRPFILAKGAVYARKHATAI